MRSGVPILLAVPRMDGQALAGTDSINPSATLSTSAWGTTVAVTLSGSQFMGGSLNVSGTGVTIGSGSDAMASGGKDGTSRGTGE